MFDKNLGGPISPIVFDELKSWTLRPEPSLKYYSGTAIYRNRFLIGKNETPTVAILGLDSICDIATIKINGIDCGTLWTQPYKLDVTKAIKAGENDIEIAVTNTWHNRLIGDVLSSQDEKVTWTTAPFRLKDKPLLPSGLIGSVKLLIK